MRCVHSFSFLNKSVTRRMKHFIKFHCWARVFSLVCYTGLMRIWNYTRFPRVVNLDFKVISVCLDSNQWSFIWEATVLLLSYQRCSWKTRGSDLTSAPGIGFNDSQLFIKNGTLKIMKKFTNDPHACFLSQLFRIDPAVR